MAEKIKVIPCSGMGKVYGLIGRESALEAAKLYPELAETMCLAYIVTGDEESKELIQGKKCITIDGCAAMCAAKSVEHEGGDILVKMKVMEAFKKHKGAKPGSATELNEEGWTITDELARDIADKINSFRQEGLENG